MRRNPGGVQGTQCRRAGAIGDGVQEIAQALDRKISKVSGPSRRLNSTQRVPASANRISTENAAMRPSIGDIRSLHRRQNGLSVYRPKEVAHDGEAEHRQDTLE